MLLSPWPDWIYTRKVTDARANAASGSLGDRLMRRPSEARLHSLQNSPDLDGGVDDDDDDAPLGRSSWSKRKLTFWRSMLVPSLYELN